MSEAGWVRNLLMDCSPPLRLVPSSSLPLCFSSSKFTLGRYIYPPSLSARILPTLFRTDSTHPSVLLFLFLSPFLLLSLSLSVPSYRRPTRNTPSRLLFFVFSLLSFFLRVARRIGRYTANRFSVLVYRVLKNYMYKLRIEGWEEEWSFRKCAHGRTSLSVLSDWRRDRFFHPGIIVFIEHE